MKKNVWQILIVVKEYFNNLKFNRIKAIVTEGLSNVLKKANNYFLETVDTGNKRWYIFLTLMLSIVWVAVSIWTLLVPISDINTEIKDLKYKYNYVFNPQEIDTSKLSDEEVIKKYYYFLNNQDFQSACSLLSTFQCKMYDVWKFTKWVNDKKRYLFTKLKDGERLVKVWNSWIKLPNTKQNIFCGIISYEMNSEKRNIYQLNQYYIFKRSTGEKEIIKVLCEKAIKQLTWNQYIDRTKAMKCWTETSYCNEGFRNFLEKNNLIIK